MDTFEDLEMDTDSLYLALAHDNLNDCIRQSKKTEWKALREHNCDDSFKAVAVQNFSSSLEIVMTSVNQICSRKTLDVLK